MKSQTDRSLLFSTDLIQSLMCAKSLFLQSHMQNMLLCPINSNLEERAFCTKGTKATMSLSACIRAGKTIKKNNNNNNNK